MIALLAPYILLGAVSFGWALGGTIQIYRREKDAKLWHAKQERDETAFILANPGKPIPPRNQLV